MRMPVMDGYEATRTIRTLPGGAQTVIIALTASAFEENRMMSLEAGAYDFVRKPFRNEEIYDKLTKHLGVRFTYQEEAQRDQVDKGMRKDLSADDLTHLPDEWVKQMHQAAAQADGEEVLRLVEEISGQNGELATCMSDLVKDFRFDILMDISQRVGVCNERSKP
ncbi:response regulator, partial [Chloroflexota bacterium]